jgi:hypothetical protein
MSYRHRNFVHWQVTRDEIEVPAFSSDIIRTAEAVAFWVFWTQAVRGGSPCLSIGYTPYTETSQIDEHVCMKHQPLLPTYEMHVSFQSINHDAIKYHEQH